MACCLQSYPGNKHAHLQTTLTTHRVESCNRPSHLNPTYPFNRDVSPVQELRRDESIAILPADKGRSTVIMDREDYIKKMRALLEDDKYRVLNKDPTLKVEKRVASSLKSIHREGHIIEQLYNQLTPSYSEPPQMYGLPKVHKERTSPNGTHCLHHRVFHLPPGQGTGQNPDPPRRQELLHSQKTPQTLFTECRTSSSSALQLMSLVSLHRSQ